MRVPDPNKEFSHGWREEFSGEISKVRSVDDNTLVTCQDALGRMGYEHFAYWRQLGETVGDSPQMPDILKRISKVDVFNPKTGTTASGQEMDLTSNSIAASADIIFRGLLYNRLNSTVKVGGQTLKWEDCHAFRFESDDLGISVSLQSLAPEGSSWTEAVSWALDAPEFYEFFLDNVERDELRKNYLRNGGGSGAGFVDRKQTRYKDATYIGRGQRIERFCVRPNPFPTYDPTGGGYVSAAWDNLPTNVAIPTGVLKIDVGRDRDAIFSAYSVDLVNSSGTETDNASRSDAQAQIVVDQDKYANHVGYRPLDPKTKRFASGNDSATVNDVALAKSLSWQLLSFNHFNDRYYSGSIESPYDHRPRLGTRYIAEGYLYYVEAYEHTIEAGGAARSTFVVTRGLSLPQYGLKLKGDPLQVRGRASGQAAWDEEYNLFPDYLGRQKPGEEFAPILLNVSSPGFSPGVVEDESLAPEEATEENP